MSESRQDARDRYQQLLRTVAHQTGGPQPPATAQRQVGLLLVTHGSLSREAYHSALRAALEGGDLVRFTDPRDGVTTRIALRTEPDLVALIEWLGEMDPTPRELVAAANHELQEVRDD